MIKFNDRLHPARIRRHMIYFTQILSSYNVIHHEALRYFLHLTHQNGIFVSRRNISIQNCKKLKYSCIFDNSIQILINEFTITVYNDDLFLCEIDMQIDNSYFFNANIQGDELCRLKWDDIKYLKKVWEELNE